VILLVRHGRTAVNAAGQLLGRADPPLDAEGLAQAAALADVAAAWPGHLRVISSPLQRCRHTAAAIAEAAGVAVEVDERWVELDYGAFEGRPLADIPAETWAAWRSDVEFRPPGGESLRELGVRVRAACDDLTVAAAE
jgi:broad specificity phosphatase PhoE